MDTDIKQLINDQAVDEKLFRLLIASVKDCAIFMIDPNGYIVTWNNGAEHIEGYNAAEIIGKHISVFYTSIDIKNNAPRTNLNQALKNGVHETEGWRVKKGGSVFWANVVFTTIYDDNGHLIGFAKVIRDITERKTNEDDKTRKNAELEKKVHAKTAKIVANELRFRKLIENSYDGITLLDENLHVFYRSHSSERIIGWSNAERESYSLTDLTHPDDRASVKDVLTKIRHTPGDTVISTYRARHKLGYYIWLECLFTNMLYDVNINAIVCNFRDITEKKQAEYEIRKKSEQIEHIFESITDGFIALDINFCYTYVNKKMGEILGAVPEGMLGKYIWDVYPDAVNSDTYHAFNKAFAEQQYICNEDYYAPLDLWQENHIYPSPTGLSVFIRDISERKKAELKLKESEQRFRDLLENSTDIVVVTGPDGQITYISPNAEKTLGYDIKKLTLEQRAAMLHPDDRSFYRKLFNDALTAPGVIHPFTYRIKNAEDRYLWIEGTVTNLLHVHAVKGLVTNSRDITKRKEQEEEIQKKHTELQQASKTQAAILNALPSNVALLNEKGKIMAVNQSWKKLALLNNLGLPNYGIGYNYQVIAEKAMGVDHVHGQQIAKGIKDVISGHKKQFIMEHPYNSPADKRWFMVIVAPLSDEAHKGAVVSHIDITDRKLAQESLVKSEDNLRSVFENTDLSIVLFDRDLKIVSFNNNAKHAAVRNYHKKLKIGESAYKYFSKERKQVIGEMIERVSVGEAVSYESLFILDDGAVEWYDVKWVGVTNKKMENVGFIMTLKNVTEKKNADLEREKITADMLRRNNDLEQYAYIVSHNLRAPVANIMGLSNLLDTIETRDKNTCEILTALSSSIHSLDKVTIDLNHILQVSSQVNSRLESVSLPLLVDEIKTGISEMVVKNKAGIVNDLAIAQFKTIKSYLYSILRNLIINSIKYRRADVDPVITISSKYRGKMVSITVADNGKGINLQKHGADLFGLYKRFDRQVEGKGVGLFMVKMQVENLGGRISVSSELNKGTQFTIELPLS